LFQFLTFLVFYGIRYVVVDSKSILWHNRLGNMSVKGMKVLHSNNFLLGLKCVNMDLCEICVYEK
jgi:hypothetical protein